MAYETIVVAYEDVAAANDAVQHIRRMGVPASDIRRHPVDAKGIEDVAKAPDLKATDPGFWHWLFGRDTEDDELAVYRTALDKGGTILSVQVMAEEAEQVRDALSQYGPLDLSEKRGL